MTISFTGPKRFSASITDVGMYSDNTPMIKTDRFIDIVEHADTMTFRGGSLLGFTTAMFLVDAIERQGGGIDNLILPYIPGARQDRSNVNGDVLFTLASVANMINSRWFDNVVVLDPHSEISNRFIIGLVEYPIENVARSLGTYSGVIAADSGGKSRAERVAKTLGVPVYYGGKTRDVTNGRLTGFTMEPIPVGHYLVADDICDGGGTFIGLADKIKEQGSTADLYVSHGIFSKGVHALKKSFNQIITTDSLEVSDVVTIIEVVTDMENYT